MGNCYRSRKETKPLAFDITEYSALNQQFQYYCDLSTESREQQALNQKSFEDIFPENPIFGIKLFKFLEVYGGTPGQVKKEPLYDFLEVMLKDVTPTVALFKNFERFELMSLISLQNAKCLTTKEELCQLQLTYLETLGILKDVIKIFQCGRTNPATDETHLRGLVDLIYKNEGGTYNWVSLVEFVVKQLPGIKGVIRQYFESKFMGKSLNALIPQFSHSSYILTDELYFQLLLSTNSTLKNAYKLQLVYSNLVHFGGVSQMMELMINCKLPTIILLQHEEQYQQTVRSHTYGALSSLKWYNTGQYFGTKEDCLFQLNPYFKVYRQRKQEQNYCYMDTDRGFGFGGKNGRDCRIWIDKDIEKSYCQSQDDTYEAGCLVQPHVKQLNLKVMEVWAIHHPQDELDMDEGVKQDLKDPVLDINAEAIEEIDSKADYYWVDKQQTTEVIQPSGYYWDTKQNLVMQSSYDVEHRTVETRVKNQK